MPFGGSTVPSGPEVAVLPTHSEEPSAACQVGVTLVRANVVGDVPSGPESKVTDVLPKLPAESPVAKLPIWIVLADAKAVDRTSTAPRHESLEYNCMNPP